MIPSGSKSPEVNDGHCALALKPANKIIEADIASEILVEVKLRNLSLCILLGPFWEYLVIPLAAEAGLMNQQVYFPSHRAFSGEGQTACGSCNADVKMFGKDGFLLRVLWVRRLNVDPGFGFQR